ncbi:hypothetical protein [uncultured Rikenella sp.]|uniref:hypothetical protein n=1 Tax=uncultured Rikenella sp. TaxID=368003 RepID=UPI00262431DB|nr:hypothetical protein [uncultured Rikenella sp.]
MKYDEKDIEELLNTEENKLQIETQSNLATIIQLLCQKKIIAEEEFIETNNKMKEIIKTNIKEKIKQILEKMEE